MVDVGEKAPEFSMATDGGGTVSLTGLKGRKVVLYFYPKDDTPGCTKEACAFRDAMPDFSGIDAEIIGVSKDPVAKHDKFKAKYDLPFTLASDEESDVCEKFGVWVEKNMYGRKYMGIERATFLIDGEGVVRNVWRKEAFNMLVARCNDVGTELSDDVLVRCVDAFLERLDFQVASDVKKEQSFSEKLEILERQNQDLLFRDEERDQVSYIRRIATWTEDQGPLTDVAGNVVSVGSVESEEAAGSDQSQGLLCFERPKPLVARVFCLLALDLSSKLFLQDRSGVENTNS